jgi:hypothetical protein
MLAAGVLRSGRDDEETVAGNVRGKVSNKRPALEQVPFPRDDRQPPPGGEWRQIGRAIHRVLVSVGSEITDTA